MVYLLYDAFTHEIIMQQNVILHSNLTFKFSVLELILGNMNTGGNVYQILAYSTALYVQLQDQIIFKGSVCLLNDLSCETVKLLAG
jgi:hypothetical protein